MKKQPSYMKEINAILKASSPRKLVKNPKRANMTYPQAKKKYPKMNPLGNFDGDIMPNIIDCRPFNRKKQDEGYTGEEWAELSPDEREDYMEYGVGEKTEYKEDPEKIKRRAEIHNKIKSLKGKERQDYIDEVDREAIEEYEEDRMRRAGIQF